MKIIGPIAGIGSRLKPFTLSKPKAFVRVAGKTVLDHILEKFNNTFDNATELILIVGYKKRQIIDYVKENYEDKFKLTFLEQIPRKYEEDIPIFWGLGESVYIARERFSFAENGKDEDDKREGALIFLGDMIILDEYSYIMYRYYESSVDGIITVMEVPKDQASSYGIVVTDEKNIITNLVEKPQTYVSNLAIAGIYAFSKKTLHALFKHLKKYLDERTENSSEIYLTESLQDLVNDGFRIAAVKLKKGILDFGRPSEVLNGNKHLLKKISVSKEDFQSLNVICERSYIKNPIHIGKNSNIFNSVIGPYCSIGDNTTIENCIISDSVIERNSSLKNIITHSSIIGSDVKVENIIKDNLIIGDKSVF